MTEFSLLTALLAALLGGVHCVGMCGGIVAAFSFRTDGTHPPFRLHLAYNLGRVSSYAIFGALAGALGASLKLAYSIKRPVKSDQSEVLLATWASEHILREYLTGSTDDGAAISALWRSKAFSRGGFGFTINRVSILTPALSATIGVRLIRDMDGVYIASRTNIPLTRAGWKHVTLQAVGHPGMHYQVEIVGSGTRQLKIDQVVIDGTILPRRIGRVL